MPSVAAGWFPDPDDPNQIHYWDGSQWTDHYRTRRSEAATPVPGTQPDIGA